MENQSLRKSLKNKINYRLFLKPSQNKIWDGFLFHFVGNELLLYTLIHKPTNRCNPKNL